MLPRKRTRAGQQRAAPPLFLSPVILNFRLTAPSHEIEVPTRPVTEPDRYRPAAEKQKAPSTDTPKGLVTKQIR